MSLSAKSIGLMLGPVAAFAAYFTSLHFGQMSFAAAVTAAITALCAVWWCSEAIPIPVTSLIPFILFPAAGILTYDELAGAFGNKFILLFLGGFMISKAAEKSNTHLRLSHALVKLVGTNSNRKLIIGFMLATAFSSMWISNTATALIMLPVAIAVIDESEGDARFAVCLLLAIAYGASIGGTASLIGTPPNGVFAATYEKTTGINVDFLTWMKVGVPVALVMLIACGILLTLFVPGKSHYRAKELGAWTSAQRRVLTVLSLTALLWITRVLPFGLGGWSVWLNMPNAHDATVALLAVLAMFLIPSGERDINGVREHLLDWPTASRIPWGILLLFAGGLAIAKAFGVSGLAEGIASGMEVATSGLHPLLIVVIICTTLTFVTELTSNTATTTLLMPILAASATAAGVEPAFFMIPAALSASCAFMLPVATPPNAIVAGGSELVTVGRMARYGLGLNLIGVVVISLLCYLILDPVNGLGLQP